MSAPMILAAVVAVVGASAAKAQPVAPPQCFDAFVRAMIVRQTPTVMPDCGPDCIVMSWPYIDRIDVKEVLRGKSPVGALTVLSIQHTYFVPREDGNEWWLRRNAIGGYNVIRFSLGEDPRRCSKSDPPAPAYITPHAGQTLEDLEKTGDGVFGHHDGPKRTSSFDG